MVDKDDELKYPYVLVSKLYTEQVSRRGSGHWDASQVSTRSAQGTDVSFEPRTSVTKVLEEKEVENKDHKSDLEL